MRLSLQIALRYAFARSGFLSFATAFAVGGMALGTAVLVVVLSVMNGFDAELRERVLGALPHALLVSREGVADWERLVERSEAHPGVRAAAPISRGAGLLAANERVLGVRLTGIDPDREAKVSILPEHLLDPDPGLASLAPGAFAVLLGDRLADRLGVVPGDEVVLVLPDPRLTIAGAFPRQKRLRVAGRFALGTELDDTGAFVHLDDARRLLRVPGGAEGVRLRLHDLFASETVVRSLLREFADPELEGYDWRGTHGNLYSAIALQKRIMIVLLSLVVAVAAFNVVSMLTMVVRNRRTDIAILRTQGLGPTPLVRIFLNQGMLIALVGIGVGIVAGLALGALLPQLVTLLEGMLGRDLLAEYFVRELPVRVMASDLVLIAVLAALISLLTTWWPARRARLVDPAEALRHE